jgi:hypothetical protein
MHNIFFEKDLVELSKNLPVSPIKNNNPVLFEITPISRMILSSLTPYSKQIMTEELRADNLFIEEYERKELENDPDYLEKMANNKLGFYMENFVSYYGVCPVCKQNTLRKYFHSNVPVVDFVCINKDYHLQTNTCFLFQLKISLGGEYFNFNQISIGSRRYGELPHSIKGSDNIKHIVPGYICLRLNWLESQSYLIDPNNSFIIVPDYHNTSNISYYQYLPYKDRYGKDIITWNSNMFTTLSVRDILNTLFVDYEYFTETIIDNPYN